jgi:catalase
MSAEQQKVLFANTARSIADATKEIKLRHIANCLKADPAYGKGVADALGIPLSEVPQIKAVAPAGDYAGWIRNDEK